MAIISVEKAKVLADKNGWTLESARGYVDGEIERRREKFPASHILVGIDDYSRGFRAAFFNRRDPDSGQEAKPAARVDRTAPQAVKYR